MSPAWRGDHLYIWCGSSMTSSTARARGKEVALMIPVVVGLTQDDMLNLARRTSRRASRSGHFVAPVTKLRHKNLTRGAQRSSSRFPPSIRRIH